MTEKEKERRLASVESVRSNIRSLQETHPHLKDFDEFLGEFNKETERGAALAAAAFLDDLLGQILKAFLIDDEPADKLLSGFGAPLSSFSTRIAMVRALGLLNEVECRECELIRKVRNEFAHKVKMTFDDKRVAGLCSGMEYRARPYGDVTVSTRGAFTTAAVGLILSLTNRPHYVGLERLAPRSWQT